MTLDLSFLGASLTPARKQPRPVNVYDVLREGWRETRVDMTLEFFLDPNERHGLGPLVMDSVLQLLDGAPFIGPAGHTGSTLVAEDAMRSSAWEIETQAEFIDVYAVNPELDLAIILENKIGHVLNNPLERYAESARKRGTQRVLVVVLAPEVRSHLDPHQQKFISAALTYADLSAEIKRAPELVEILLSPRDLDQRRSIDLLQQFIEARSGDEEMSDLEDEANRLIEWRRMLDEHGAALRAFEEARSAIGHLIRDRRKRLEPIIADRFVSMGLATDWESHGGIREETWNAYYFPAADWTVELKFSADPSRPLIFVYDRRGRTYKDSTIAPLDVTWSDSDEQIADAFISRTAEIIGLAQAGIRVAHDS